MIFLIFVLPSLIYSYKSILILRHGARDPDVWTEIDTKKLWTDPINILTQKGVNQLIQVGESQQRAEIFDSQGNCIYELLELQSSKTARCTSSTVCFIKGLCPKNYAQILHRFFTEYYTEYVNSQKKFKKILESDFSDPLSLDYDIFESGDFMFQGHKTSQCPNLKAINKEIEKSKEYTTQQTSFLQMKEFNGIYDIMVQAYPSKKIDKSQLTLTDVDDIYDDYFCNSFQGYNFPNPSDEIINYMIDVVKFLKYTGKNSVLFQHQAALTEPFKWLIQELKSNQQFSLYSGTESNQFAIMSVLLQQEYLTPFASQLEFIIKGENVYVYFNKILQKTNVCENEYNCTIEQYTTFLNQFIVKDIKKHCGVSLKK